jgi:carbonic anhydrase
VAGCCECGNEPAVSIKFSEFLDQLKTYWVFRKDSAPCSSSVSWLVGWLVSYEIKSSSFTTLAKIVLCLNFSSVTNTNLTLESRSLFGNLGIKFRREIGYTI